MTTYVVWCCPGAPRPCAFYESRYALDAAQRFAKSRGYRCDEMAWLGPFLILGGLKFYVLPRGATP